MSDPSTRTLILASTSPWRREVLERLGVPFEVVDPAVDEDALRHLPPEEMVRALAIAKAQATTGLDGLVIGSDQAVDLGGEVLGKPGTPERAVDQLLKMQGRSHRLLTGVAVHDTRSGRTEVDLDVHVLTMRPLGREALEAYVAYDQPLGCAGSYKLESRGVALFESIQADPDLADDTAIVGLPLLKTLRLLRNFGWDLWSAE